MPLQRRRNEKGRPEAAFERSGTRSGESLDQKKWRMPTSKPFDLPPSSRVPIGVPVPCGEMLLFERSPLSSNATVPYIAVRLDRLYWYVAATFQILLSGRA